jgi:hypothetical protein
MKAWRETEDSDVGDRPLACDFGISAVPDPGVHDVPTIILEMSSDSISARASQSRAAK